MTGDDLCILEAITKGGEEVARCARAIVDAATQASPDNAAALVARVR
jgi:hypothetical protein